MPKHPYETQRDEATDPAASSEWFLYLVRCNNRALYTGITTDVERRFQQHSQGKGAKYLRGKMPLTLEFQTRVGSHSQALKAEWLVKKCNKDVKESIIKNGLPETIKLALAQLVGSEQMESGQA